MRLLVACMLALLTGCASMIRGRPQPVQFTSEPPGAQVVCAAAAPYPTWCLTPCTLTIPRSRNPTRYTVELVGREPVDDELIPASNWGFGAILVAVDLVLFFPLAIIDLTGPAGYDYPQRVDVTLPEPGQPPRVRVDRGD